MKLEPGHYDTLTGFKATNADMTCRGFQFQIGVWHHIPKSKPLKLCDIGFHFCIHPSGPRAFYPHPTDRVFKCEAKDVLVEETHGASAKCVARHIRLVSEIKPSGNNNTGNNNTGDCNTGYGNTGNCNTNFCNTGNYNAGGHNAGDYNAGDYNAGDYNTGDHNEGNRNTGHYNTGYGNTGDRNTGDRNAGIHNTGIQNTGLYNTGNCNTGIHNTGNHNAGIHNEGHGNTGNYNTGSGNTGNYNTGRGNTGSGNATDNCTGFFCTEEPGILCFDKPTNLTRTEFLARYGTLMTKLAQQLSHPEKFDYTAYKALPGWSLRKIKALHMKVQQP
jgi:hypothetical protein